jgi:iron complex transport system permease protein
MTAPPEVMPQAATRRALMRAMLLLTLGLAAVVALAVSCGAVTISWKMLLAGDATTRAILVGIRLPRVLAGALAGAILATAGLTFQTLLRNPLADPFILGISGGAACGAAVTSALGLAHVPGLVAIVAFAGACGATLAVFVLARRRGHTDPTRLLLSGLVLNALFSAVILIAFALAPQADLTAALRWMMGTLAGSVWSDVVMLLVVFAASSAVLVFAANDLRLLAFGEDDARARGVNVERIRLAGFAAASVATGAAVAVSGIIGFVGLLVPHLVRLVWRRDFRFLLPLCAAGGAALLVASDLVARVALAPGELPIGAFTALLGVPFFLSLLRRDR